MTEQKISSTLRVTAPGKVVLFGEYAVLTGAPAAVMAVNAYASVELSPSKDDQWHFSSAGFKSHPSSYDDSELPKDASAGFTTAALAHWGYRSLHELAQEPMHIRTDTTAFFVQDKKLGLGSSAAACTATCVALAQRLKRQPALQEALAIHRNWQGGKGSGLDVASCWSGGVIRFQNGATTALPWPENLGWQVVWSGTSAMTTDHIAHFDEWRKQADLEPLNRLSDLSNRLCDTPTMSLLAAYQGALMDLDNAADLKIFSAEHQELVKIASALGLVYKPCGAGGGDIGIAFTDLTQGTNALEDFRNAATAAGFYCPTLETDQHGVRLAQ